MRTILVIILILWGLLMIANAHHEIKDAYLKWRQDEDSKSVEV